MKTTAWLFKNVILPLAPFVLGALVRVIAGSELGARCFSPTELAFSMAMMFLLLASSTSRLTNADLREMLVNGFHLGVFFFMALFTLALYLDIAIASATHEFIALAQTKLSSTQTLALTDLPQSIADNERTLERTRLATLIAAAVSTVLAVWVGKRYDLMN